MAVEHPRPVGLTGCDEKDRPDPAKRHVRHKQVDHAQLSDSTCVVEPFQLDTDAHMGTRMRRERKALDEEIVRSSPQGSHQVFVRSLGRHHQTAVFAVAAVAVAAVGDNWHGVRVTVAAKNGEGRVGA